MRRFALIFLAFSLALPATAQTAKRDEATPPPPPVRRMSPAPSKADEIAQCKATCSRTYYFCISGSDQTDCSPKWSQCLSRCNR